MTKEQVIAICETAGRDLFVCDCDDEVIVEVYDFIGFNDDWSEEMRQLDNAELVNTIYDIFKKHCNEFIEDFYDSFIFDDFTVTWGYSSYNI